MKVLWVASANHNGINNLIRLQSESITARNVNVEFFGIFGKGVKGYLLSIHKLRNLIRHTTPDIVHAHYSLSGLVAGLTFTRTPLVVSLMGSDVKSGSLFNFLIRLFSAFFWDVTIIKSESMKLEIGLKKAVLIPNGVNINLIKSDSVTVKDYSKQIILFPADPDRKEKNFSLAREAFSLLNKDNVTLKVVCSKSHSEIIEEIQKANVVLLTSLWEGSPNIVKEAMACNRPVVSTDVGDVKWLFGKEPGHFITSFDPMDVAYKLKLALEFSIISKMTRGRDRIVKLGLESEKIAERLIDVYKSVFNN